MPILFQQEPQKISKQEILHKHSAFKICLSKWAKLGCINHQGYSVHVDARVLQMVSICFLLQMAPTSYCQVIGVPYCNDFLAMEKWLLNCFHPDCKKRPSQIKCCGFAQDLQMLIEQTASIKKT